MQDCLSILCWLTESDIRESISSNKLRLTLKELLAYWKMIEEPPAITEKQRQLGRVMRGED